VQLHVPSSFLFQFTSGQRSNNHFHSTERFIFRDNKDSLSDGKATDFSLSLGHGRPATCVWATSHRQLGLSSKTGFQHFVYVAADKPRSLIIDSETWNAALVNISRQGYYKHQTTIYLNSLPSIILLQNLPFSIVMK
jgi:hypothetical protein